jgi:rfaE bifunctional protein nucleotidyltransferase chain/domain
MFCKDLSELKALIQQWKQSGETIVFTNGVFDILHLGHVDYLEKSKALGSKLIVGINSDSSVKRLEKGEERPINPEFARATIVAALRCVDATVIFSEDTPFDLIMDVMPDVLVKGGDYDPEEFDSSKKSYIVGSKEIRQAGGTIAAIPLVSGYSTTNIVRKLSK